MLQLVCEERNLKHLIATTTVHDLGSKKQYLSVVNGSHTLCANTNHFRCTCTCVHVDEVINHLYM